MSRFRSVLVAAALAGCAGAPMADPAVDRITYETTPPPFCGRCETLKFTASADGVLRVETGHYAGDYRDWRRRHEVRRITPEQFAEFKARLAPYRGERDIIGGEEGCRDYYSDDAGLRVEWASGSERRVRVFDFGCKDDPAMNNIVLAAPGALSLRPLF